MRLEILPKPSCGFQFMDLRRSHRKKVNGTTDECPDNRTVNTDILKIAAEDQFETVGNGSRIPVPHDLCDQQSDLTTPLKQLCYETFDNGLDP